MNRYNDTPLRTFLLALVLAIFAEGTLAAGEHNITITINDSTPSGTLATSSTIPGGTAVWDQASKTLTLMNFALDTSTGNGIEIIGLSSVRIVCVGTVTVKSGGVDAIYSDGSLIISGHGSLNATGYNSHGINSNGVVTITGNAIVRASGVTAIRGTSDFRQSIVFENYTGTVYGGVTLLADLTVDYVETLTIPTGASLTIPSGKTLWNKGTLTNDGTLTDNGTFINTNTYNGASTVAELYDLYIDAGTLYPAFAPYMWHYTASVTYATSYIIITAIPDNDATLTGDYGLQYLYAGSNPFRVTVTSKDGKKTEDYTVTITRERDYDYDYDYDDYGGGCNGGFGAASLVLALALAALRRRK
ncbi:hypothetical protein FACS1894204_01080 [Synergistales bacterium]|nr:hypothetical protein AGMMS49957_16330 [Synergistales bacterium]GHV44256.1 hypothetical protein FACS1894204_01080 [Synergistales bacterium]